MSASLVIETESLTRHYGAVVALDALTVRVESGITGLVGANGAGKSTLLKILLGLVEPTSGTARVMGHAIDAERQAIRRLVGYMPEHDCLPPDMSATEFVTWMARCSGFPPSAARERAAEVLRHVGLFEERYRPMGGYSTGMAQRVKLAQALVHDPALLILDEPTNGLDPAGRDDMLALIERTGREFGISVVVSSHLLGELERICDGVVLIDNGRLIRAERLGVLTGVTSTLIVEIDGDAMAFAHALASRGVRATADRQSVLVTVPDASDVPGERATFDAVRDVAVERHAALLRMERRRGHLEDLFDVAS
ncbi:MAG: ABC transporter ATP-binding protein [Gemmatimonadaceae bacterium]|nr:ABC transporter ATP-binding protein [Gemmatimonadaceae bacterium]